MTHEIPIPPSATNHRGEPRRVGIELELSGLGVDQLSKLVVKCFGGRIEALSDYEQRVVATEFGDFNVELDFEYLKTLGRDDDDARQQVSELELLSEAAIAEIAQRIVPFEIVTPPLPLDALDRVDVLVSALRAHGARGTRHSPVYAFGLHLNPELPSLEAPVIVSHVRAFLCLYEWLVAREEVNWSRRLTPYINPYPRAYVKRVVDPGYAPTIEAFTDDYLTFNADRNRALDLLPLLAFIDEARVRSVIDDPRVKLRPTFHYRLPNCDVDVADWGITQPWTRWLQVECLAHDSSRLSAMAAAYLAHLDNGLAGLVTPWRNECTRWLNPAGR